MNEVVDKERRKFLLSATKVVGGVGCAFAATPFISSWLPSAKAMAAGNRAGFDISKAHAMRWITSNPAKAAGILNKTGSIEIDKDADVVLWTGNPFSVYSRAEKVFIDGALVFDMHNPKIQPITDFDLGIIQPQNNRVE